MNKEDILTELKKYLDTFSVVTLRVIARTACVPQSSFNTKDALVEGIAGVVSGELKPVPRSNRGAPAKQNYVDPAVRRRLDEYSRMLRLPDEETEGDNGVALPSRTGEPVFSGILEITQGGYGFLRAHNCQPSNNGSDVFIPAPVIHQYRLREGDFVACTAKPRLKNDSPAINEILTVNGLPVGRYEQRPLFDNLTAEYASEKITLSDGNCDLALRVLDLFIPIGKGQRALIIAPPKAGKTTLLKSVARSVAENHRDLTLIILLIDERPEEVTDMRTSVPGAEVIYSTFDEGADHHIRAAELTIEHAKRLAEMGQDVVILLDSLTKLTRAYNYAVDSSGKTLSGGLDAGAFAEPKRFFGAARNTREAGSITVLATALVETGSRMDDVIYEEFKGTGNADVFLSRDLAERRIFPAIDIRRSGTRKEELLLTEEELAAVYKLRERGITENAAGILDMLKRTSGNAEFVSRLSEWLRIYKNV